MRISSDFQEDEQRFRFTYVSPSVSRLRGL